MDHEGVRRYGTGGVVLRIICSLFHVVVFLAVVLTLYVWWHDWRSARNHGDDFLGIYVAAMLMFLCMLDLVMVVVAVALRKLSPSWLVMPIVAMLVGCMACVGGVKEDNDYGAVRHLGPVVTGGSTAAQ